MRAHALRRCRAQQIDALAQPRQLVGRDVVEAVGARIEQHGQDLTQRVAVQIDEQQRRARVHRGELLGQRRSCGRRRQVAFAQQQPIGLLRLAYLVTDPSPFALSLSKCLCPSWQGFDKLSPNGRASGHGIGKGQ